MIIAGVESTSIPASPPASGRKTI